MTFSAAPLFCVCVVLLLSCAARRTWAANPRPTSVTGVSFDHETALDEQFHHLYWTVLSETEIEFGLESTNSLGWVGFGLSPNGGMSGADLVMGWIDASDGRSILQNRYAVGNSEPLLMDDQTNVQLVADLSRVDGVTFMHFTRKLYGCDAHSVDIVQGTSKVIFASSNYVPGPGDGAAAYHGPQMRGSKSVNLLQGESDAVPMPADVETVDLVLEEYVIPAAHTTYHCKLMALPKRADVNHIIRVDPIITPGNEALVHHSTAFYCPAIDFEEDGEHIGFEADCDDWANMGFVAAKCLQAEIWTAWAVGGGDFYFPEHVGYEFGGTDPYAMTHVVLQIHFDNPFMREGVVDSSGLRVWFTPTLRQHSASMLQIGPTLSPYGLFIPGGIPSVTVNGQCVQECTQDAIPAEGVYAIGGLLHSHVLGRALKLRQIRDGVELPTVDVNAQYDFDYQQTWILPEERLILPGDALQFDCTYDSSARTEMTWAGESTREEMCVSLLYVYPKVELSHCSTIFDPMRLYLWWTQAVVRGWAQGPVDFENMHALEFDASTPEALAFYESLWTEKKRAYTCTGRWNSDEDFELTEGEIPLPGIDFVEYEEPDLSDCMINTDSVKQGTQSSSGSSSSKNSNERVVNEWYFALGISFSVLLIVLFALYFLCRQRKLKGAIEPMLSGLQNDMKNETESAVGQTEAKIGGTNFHV